MATATHNNNENEEMNNMMLDLEDNESLRNFILRDDILEKTSECNNNHTNKPLDTSATISPERTFSALAPPAPLPVTAIITVVPTAPQVSAVAIDLSESESSSIGYLSDTPKSMDYKSAISKRSLASTITTAGDPDPHLLVEGNMLLTRGLPALFSETSIANNYQQPSAAVARSQSPPSDLLENEQSQSQNQNKNSEPADLASAFDIRRQAQTIETQLTTLENEHTRILAMVFLWIEICNTFWAPLLFTDNALPIVWYCVYMSYAFTMALALSNGVRFYKWNRWILRQLTDNDRNSYYYQQVFPDESLSDVANDPHTFKFQWRMWKMFPLHVGLHIVNILVISGLLVLSIFIKLGESSPDVMTWQLLVAPSMSGISIFVILRHFALSKSSFDDYFYKVTH